MERGKDGKFHILYKIENKINGRFYIGIHSTRNLDDGYMGSGKRIKNEIRKYGKENFNKLYLVFVGSRQELYLEEQRLVDENLLKNNKCLNISKGGRGCWDHVNAGLSAEQRTKISNSSKRFFGKQHSEKTKHILSALKTGKLNPSFGKPGNTEKAVQCAMTLEAIEKRKKTFEIRKHQQGENNSQVGSKWITNGTEIRKIRKDESLPDGYKFGRLLNRE